LFASLKESNLGENFLSFESLEAFGPVFNWLSNIKVIETQVPKKIFEDAYQNLSKSNNLSSNPLFL